MNRPALFTEADLRRAIRAAVKERARVTVRIDGTGICEIEVNGAAEPDVAPEREIVF